MERARIRSVRIGGLHAMFDPVAEYAGDDDEVEHVQGADADSRPEHSASVAADIRTMLPQQVAAERQAERQRLWMDHRENHRGCRTDSQ